MSKANPTAVLLRKHYRDHAKFLRKQMTHLFVLYRTCEELRRELGPDGLRHWMRVHCPEIPWEHLKKLFDQARSTTVKGLEHRLGRN